MTITPEIQHYINSISADAEQKHRAQETTFMATITALRIQREANADSAVQFSVQLAALVEHRAKLEATIVELQRSSEAQRHQYATQLEQNTEALRGQLLSYQGTVKERDEQILDLQGRNEHLAQELRILRQKPNKLHTISAA